MREVVAAPQTPASPRPGSPHSKKQTPRRPGRQTTRFPPSTRSTARRTDLKHPALPLGRFSRTHFGPWATPGTGPRVSRASLYFQEFTQVVNLDNLRKPLIGKHLPVSPTDRGWGGFFTPSECPARSIASASAHCWSVQSPASAGSRNAAAHPPCCLRNECCSPRPASSH